MRIGLDIRYTADYFPGIGRYVANLARALADLEHPHTLVLLHNPALVTTHYRLDDLHTRPGIELAATAARPFAPSEQVRLPWLARALRLDVLHSPYYIKPYGGLPCPSVVTIYDLIGRRFPHLLSRRGRMLFNLLSMLAVRTATRIITLSRNSRNDIAAAYQMPKHRIAVTPAAADQHFRPQSDEDIAAMRDRYNLPPRYVLYLGSNKPHKNLERLVRAWERLVQAYDDPFDLPHLVIAGHHDPRYPEARRMVRQRALEGSVQFVPNVAEADMAALYSGAEMFVFPSFYEGFGLPPLEAMACGAPVLCAASSSLPEVVGDAAHTFDPYNFVELAESLRWLLDHASVRDHLRAKGFEQARAFSWERTARATLDVYESVL
jgi:alpha-1,3-rhamnosyl/mannosyltransferase